MSIRCENEYKNGLISELNARFCTHFPAVLNCYRKIMKTEGKKMDIMKSVMDFEFDTRSVQTTHFHQNIEIVYVLDGGVRIEVESEEYELEKGDFLLINANKRHALHQTRENLLTVSFRINFSILSEYMETNQILFWCNTVIDKSEAYEQLKKVFERILNRYYERDKEGALYLNSLYYEALYILTSYFMIRSDDTRIKEWRTTDNSRIFEIQNYVQANYQKQISLNDLAKKLYLSNAYLSKYIKKNFGLSFLEYVNNIRLFHAVDDLTCSDKQITRIALENGFPTIASFNKAFKDVYQMTPSAYRKNLNQYEEIKTEEKEEKERIEERVKEYLRGSLTVQDPVATKNMNVLEADEQKKEKLEKNWSEIINVGKIELLLDSNMQNQIITMRDEIGFRYVRVWNIFISDLYEERDGDWHYNFSRVDRALDFLVENQLKPYIELSFKPLNVSYTINSSLTEKDNDIIFHDKESYEKVMNDFASHLINRFGMAEVENWYFELWKDERMNMQDENGWYFDCFEAGYHALKRISDKIKVGGAGFALGYDRYSYRSLIKNWKKRRIRPDFISVYSYSYFLIQHEGLYFGKRSLDSSFVKNQLEIFKQILKEEEFEAEELHITEWNFTISNRNCINDSCAQGAFVMKTCIDAVGKADMMGFWHGSDLHSEYFDTSAVLCGDNGLLTRDGIKKPSFYAFHFMGFLQPYLLAKSENALVSSNGKGNYTIVCHNCKQLNYSYTMKEENDIRISDPDELYEDLDAIHLEFKIRNVENGEYIVRIFYVNRENGSVQDGWKDMDYLENLAKGEIEYMRRNAMPKVEMRKVVVEDNVLRLETKMQAHEIKALDIRYQY